MQVLGGKLNPLVSALNARIFSSLPTIDWLVPQTLLEVTSEYYTVNNPQEWQNGTQKQKKKK